MGRPPSVPKTGRRPKVPDLSPADEFRRAVLRVRQNRREYVKTYVRIVVSNLIQELRVHAGLTQTELADRIGMRQPDVSHLERALGSRAAELLTIVRIADECGFDLELISTEKSSEKRKAKSRRVLLTPPRD